MKVFVAEESPAYRQQIAGVLASAGFEVDRREPSEGVVALESGEIALAVISLRLAMVDPLLLVRRAGELRIPTLVVSPGFYDHEARESCQLGADSVWVYPLDLDRFVARAKAVAVPEPAEPLVLLIDDTLETRRAIRRTLERERFRIVEADRGVEGVRIAVSRRIDLIILDVHMPGLDGWSVCEILKGEHATSRIPILVCTVRSGTNDQLRAMTAGADGFLAKPFSPEQLLDSVRKLLQKSAAPAPKVE